MLSISVTNAISVPSVTACSAYALPFIVTPSPIACLSSRMRYENSASVSVGSPAAPSPITLTSEPRSAAPIESSIPPFRFFVSFSTSLFCIEADSLSNESNR